MLQIHKTDLIEKAKSGEINKDEMDELIVHVTSCRACRGKLIRVGIKYVHYKKSDSQYKIVAIARDEKTYQLSVIYRGLGSSTVWSRTLRDFFTPVKRFQPRFKELNRC